MTAMRQWPRPDLKRIPVSGIPVAVEIVRNGDRPQRAIAWLHGLGSASTLAFAEAARHAALAGTTSLLIDLPGFGLSGRPGDWSYTIEDHAAIVCDLLAMVTDRPITLVGHSLGGSVAITCAYRAPGAVERLIVAEPTLDMFMGHLSAHIAAQRETRFVERGYRALVAASERAARAEDAGSSSWLATLRVASPVALHRSAVSLLAERSPTFREQLDDLAMPRAYLRGERSPLPAPAPMATGLEGYVVPDAGHDLMADNPDAFAAIIAAILGLASSDPE